VPYADRDRVTAVGTCFMAKQSVPDELWTIIEPLLPAEPLRPNGGRTRVPDRAAFAGIMLQEKREPTSGLEPLYCSLRVIGQALQGFARGCKSRISKRLSLLQVAACCTVLRPRCCQSGVKRGAAASQS
jgi:hypothetical protein